jgi:hypothetical protein
VRLEQEDPAMGESRCPVLDRPEVSVVLFHPRREAGPPQLRAGVYTVRLPVADGVSVGGKIFVARAGAPVILYFHGNGEIAADYDPIASLYTRLGLTLFVVDYRGYGASDGVPSASALLDDARASFAKARPALAERGIDAGPLFVMGRSLGSAAALEIASGAAAGDIAGLILESAFADTMALIQRLGGRLPADADEGRDGFGNLAKMATVSLPTLVIHGEDDWIIPVEDGRALFAASPAVDKRLVTIPGAGHNDLMMTGLDTYFRAIADFCRAARWPG